MPALPASPVFWWSAVAVYTASLPGAIFAWRALDQALGRRAAGAVPAALFLLLAGAALARLGGRAWPRLAAALLLGAAGLWWAPSAPKGIHVPLYMGLAWLLARALAASGGVPRRRLWVAAAGVLLGISEELLQGWVPGRYYAWGDMGINALGVLAGAVLLEARAPRQGPAPAPGAAAAWALAQAAVLVALAALLQWRWHQTGAPGLALGPYWAAGLLAWLMASTTAFEGALARPGDWPWRAVFYPAAGGLLVCAAGAGMGALFR